MLYQPSKIYGHSCFKQLQDLETMWSTGALTQHNVQSPSIILAAGNWALVCVGLNQKEKTLLLCWQEDLP